MGLDMAFLDHTAEKELGYFCKFNALHGYIVDKFAGGKDDCGPIPLNKADVVDIFAALCDVLAYPESAPDRLPVCEGPFFGSYEYDGDYFDQVKEAKEFFRGILKDYDFEAGDLIYWAGW